MAKVTILLVEDSEQINDVMCAVLEDEGYEVTSVTTVAAAIAALRSAVPACIVLDGFLPDGTAEDVLVEACALANVPPTVMMTASPEGPVIAARYGVPFLEKPFDIDLLAAAVAHAVEHQVRPVAPAR